MGKNDKLSGFYHTETSFEHFSRDDIASSDGEKTPLSISRRSLSFHESQFQSKTFLISDIEKTKVKLLSREDTNKDYQITIEDKGPKDMSLGSFDSDGCHLYHITGHYPLSNLLQELQLHYNSQFLNQKNVNDENDENDENNRANDNANEDSNQITWPSYPRRIIMNESVLRENPTLRLSRMISFYFWKGLTRTITNYKELLKVCHDPKDRNLIKKSRIYIPFNDFDALAYYQNILKLKKERDGIYNLMDRNDHNINSTANMEIVILPQVITLNYIRSLYKTPGLLCLDFRLSYIVPGGRFNELYGWDSFFILLGLLEEGKEEYNQLAINLVDNLCYELRHYGKVLNANRTYYLFRTQPPFLLEMAIRIYEKGLMPLNWLLQVLSMAIKEYEQVWTSHPRYIAEYGLSRYFDEGFGMPPETESTHYNRILQPSADRMGMSIEEYREGYNNETIIDPLLDEFFIHDRAVRESGHDTTCRLEGRAANLFTVDLNSLLFKVEMNIAKILELTNQNQSDAELWRKRAQKRCKIMNDLMWDEKEGLWFDYDFVKRERISYESVTSLWPLWAGMCTEEQITLTIEKGLSKFEMIGGLVSGTERSIHQNPTNLLNPNRQWDYPYGWAPHQIIAWEAFIKISRMDIARRLTYRWLYTITKAFYDYNGVVPEKFNVVTMSHRVEAEYGNQGIDFKCVSSEGFGWTNASYKLGQSILTLSDKRALGALVPPNKIFFK